MSVKIAYLYDLKIFPPKGGNHVHALELVKGFVAAGHEVAVVEDETAPGVTNFLDTRETLKDLMAWCDVLYVRVDARSLREWGALNTCYKYKGSVAIVWEVNSPASETLAYSYYGGMEHWDRQQETMVRKLKRLLHVAKKIPSIWREERYRKSIAKEVSAAVCVSSSMRNYARDYLNIENSLVVPNGAVPFSRDEIDARMVVKTARPFTVLYSGSAIYPWQGLNYLSEVAAIARKKTPDIRFLIVVNQLTEAVPQGENIEVRVGMARDELMSEICRADICLSIQPEFFWSRWKFHGSPMKLFEYMACGTLVLASNIGQMSELIQDGVNGLLCESEPESIFNKIMLAHNHPREKEEMAFEGWKLVNEELNWVRNVEHTIELFNSVTSQKTESKVTNSL
tara:strand:- start:9653 stop:10843 length:1191 start_codon:yes stop_codon:yes gene_type:complete